MRTQLVVAVALFVTSAPSGLAGQRAEDACSYDTCALRVERRFWGSDLVRGAAGERMSGLGFFGADLTGLVQRSDSAVHYARLYRRDQRVSTVLAVVGGLATVIALAKADPFDADSDPGGAEWAVLVGGLGVVLASGHYQSSASRALSRAIWWYNRDLPRQ
ncbi:MAG TPA: hypothetical protein VJ803_07890 [Gemmatimonadaceae bacterium]|nr:hypothetical protein [Gemmatimonadaceae bacterium]